MAIKIIHGKKVEKLSWTQRMNNRVRINGDDDYFIVGSMGRTRFNDADADKYWNEEGSSWLFTDGNRIIRIGGVYSPNADETYTIIVDRNAKYSEIMHNARWIPEDHDKHPTYFFD